MTGLHVCPACGYPSMEEPPRLPAGGASYEICSSCGFEFGVTDDDKGYSYDQWRARWVAGGMAWWAQGLEDPPAGWNPRQQLAALLD